MNHNATGGGGLDSTFPFVVRPATEGDSGFIAEFPDLPGCFARGATRAEAAAAGEAALRIWLERAAYLGIPIPKPGTSQGLTGHLRIRVPKTMHRDIALLSNEVRLSLNETVTQLLYRAVARAFGDPAKLDPQLCMRLGPATEVTRRPVARRFDPDRTFSGSWLQRIPAELHVQLSAWAQAEGTSLNVLVNYALTRELERRLNHEPEAARDEAA
ncbi:MAG: toxin-antitoxin system HicB family antitoxin [Caulobacter sp.]